MRRGWLVVVFLAVAACKADDECSGFGCFDEGASTADEASSTGTAPTGTESADDDDDDGSSGPVSASMTGDDDDGSTTVPGNTSGDDAGSSSGADDESTTAPPCEGDDCPVLGECFGIGIWESCDQFCEANDAVCVEGGCAGATVVLYGDAMACIDMRSNGDADQPCDAGFEQQGGAVSFGRCCCDG